MNLVIEDFIILFFIGSGILTCLVAVIGILKSIIENRELLNEMMTYALTEEESTY